ncbi:MAG: zinc-dependent metalloprotease [Phycisphaerales bacterium]|nr:MAG: zinc-dependent metalloprotease [Phycisphaerales bacterium]
MSKMRSKLMWAFAAIVMLGVAGTARVHAKDAKKSDYPEFKEVTRDMEVKSGFFTLYYDKDQDKLLCRVPKSMLNKPFLLAMTVAGGPVFTGFQWGDAVVHWERLDKQLVLMEADPRYKKAKGHAVEDVVRRTYTDRIVQSVKIVTEAPKGDPVIDLADLFKTDFAGLESVYGRKIDRSLSAWVRIKAFPKNVELAVDTALMVKKGQGGSLARVHYSLSELQAAKKYEPRHADDRVGYYITAVKDWSAAHEARTVFERYINRWHLEKVDPKADVSDVTPETQITFYLEKTIPTEYRPYVRAGVLEWNKAFEKAGLRNAIQVIQQTDDPERGYADLDPEDVRYNFIRWIVSGQPFAMGPSRVNPSTGQILDADIIIDDSMVRAWIHREYDVFGPKSMAPFHDAPVDRFLEVHSAWKLELESPLERLGLTGAPISRSTPFTVDGGDQPRNTERLLHERLGPCCEHGRGAARQLAIAAAFARATTDRDLPEEFIGQALKETVMHEVGHTLGLRHNFKASAWKPLEEINRSTSVDEPVTASVMDYNPYNFAAVQGEQGVFATPTLGPYDYWAIEYGYRQTDESFKDEKKLLKSITDRVAEPGLDYGTDEDSGLFEPDPLTFRWDNGNDPLAFARQQIARFERLLEDAPQWAVKDGESYSRLRRVVDLLLMHYGFGVQVAGRTVGGQYVHRDHKGDPDARPAFEPVSAQKQREALEFVGDTVLSDNAFRFSPDLLNHLGPGRWRHWDSDDYDATQEYRIHDRIRSLQGMALFVLMNPFTVNRLYDAQLQAAEAADVLTVPELFSTLTDVVWSELSDSSAAGPWDNRRPRINSVRRNLQRVHLRRLLEMVLSAPGAQFHADCHALARMQIRDLRDRIDGLLEPSGANLDDYTLAHLQECRVKITKALDARFDAR